MSAAPDLVVPAEREILSPELVLVDPRLSLRARNLLADPGEMPARMGRRPTPSHGRELESGSQAEPAALTNDDIGAALRRITELSEVVPPKRRKRRLLTLVALGGASSGLELLVLDLQLGLSQWPF